MKNEANRKTGKEKLTSLEDIVCLPKGWISVGETIKVKNVEFNQKDIPLWNLTLGNFGKIFLNLLHCSYISF